MNTSKVTIEFIGYIVVKSILPNNHVELEFYNEISNPDIGHILFHFAYYGAGIEGIVATDGDKWVIMSIFDIETRMAKYIDPHKVLAPLFIDCIVRAITIYIEEGRKTSYYLGPNPKLSR